MYKPTTSCGEIGLILHEIYQIVLGYKANGVFVEVGANDGKTGSFTYNLANTGWKGLYIEPVPRIYQECKKNHENNDVIVLNMLHQMLECPYSVPFLCPYLHNHHLVNKEPELNELLVYPLVFF